MRAKQAVPEKKNYDEDDVDFGANFERFATYKQANMGGDNINDFDFNAAIEKKEEVKVDLKTLNETYPQVDYESKI